MLDPNDEWAEAVSKIRLRLLQIVREPATAATNAADAIEDLEHLDRLFRRTRGRRRRAEVANARPGNEYRIEPGKRGPVLAEYFAEDRPPFKCDRSVHDGIAAALETLGKPSTVEDIVRAARKTTRPDLPDYLVRECLRFWISREPPLIEKIGTRYRTLGGLLAKAKKAWLELQKVDEGA